MDLKDTCNKIANDYHKKQLKKDWWISSINKFLSLNKKNASILDLGCGSGVKSKYLTDKGLKVTGIDFAEKMIKIAKKYAPKAKFVVMDIKDIDKLNMKFDGILAQAVLLHIPKKEIYNILVKLKDQLKENGYLYISVKEIKPNEKEEGIVKKNDYGYEYESFFSYFTLSEIKKYINKLKMKIIHENIVKTKKRNWIIVITKKINN